MDVIAAFLALSVDQRYLDSVGAITSYSSLIASQSPPSGLPSAGQVDVATRALNDAKIVSLRWFNEVYPACLDLPQTILAESGTITGTLAELSSLADQLASDPGNQVLESAINTGATQLAGHTAALRDSCANLGNQLAGYRDALGGSCAGLNNGAAALNDLLCQLVAAINSDIARIDALRSKTCPNQGDIDSAERILQNDQAYFSATQLFAVQLATCSQRAGDALGGLGYLATYWLQLADIAQQSTQAVLSVVCAPPFVMQLDLRMAGDAWQNLLDQLEAITTQAKLRDFAIY